VEESRKEEENGQKEEEERRRKEIRRQRKKGMWLEAHFLASQLPLKSVTNLDYRMHLRRQRILTALEVGTPSKSTPFTK
jgi:hypothetical protein